MSEEKNYFTCCYCIYAQLKDPPEDMKEQYPFRRGFCIFEPPKVFPMPRAKESKIQAMGNTQPQMDFLPFMMRPVVDENEPMCGRGVLNVEAMEALGINQKTSCGDCKDEGDKCEC
jgi:hypothetical protein